MRLKPTASPAAIRKAIEAVLREPRYRNGARALRDAIAAEALTVDPVALIEELSPADGAVTRAS